MTIPKHIRDKLSIQKYDKVSVETGEGFVKITPTRSILDIAPLAKAPKGKSAIKARISMENTYSRI